MKTHRHVRSIERQNPSRKERKKAVCRYRLRLEMTGWKKRSVGQSSDAYLIDHVDDLRQRLNTFASVDRRFIECSRLGNDRTFEKEVSCEKRERVYLLKNRGFLDILVRIATGG